MPDDLVTRRQADHIPNVGDLYAMNRGRGPALMRIDRLAYGQAFCRHVGPRGRRFVLPLWFLSSPACGWRLADAEPLPEGVQ